MPRSRPRPIALLVPLAIAGIVVGCSDDAPASTEAYCGLVETNLTALNTPSLGTPADVDTTLSLYRQLAEAAPLAVRAEWQTVAGVVETAATVTPGDTASMQAAFDAARAAEPASRAVAESTSTTCGLTLAFNP